MIQSFDVKALRERIGWTQEQMARYLGVDRSSVSRMENGQSVSGPVLRLIVILAAAADAGTADALLTSETAAAADAPASEEASMTTASTNAITGSAVSA